MLAIYLRKAFLAVALTIAGPLLLSASCKKDKQRRPQKEPESIAEADSVGAGSTVNTQPIRTAQSSGPMGTVRGVVKFTGTAPKMPLINNGSDPVCAQHKLYAQTILVAGSGDNQTLQNSLVRVKPHTVPGRVPKTPIEIKQTQCMYQPRIQAGVVGQQMLVYNVDATAHNVHVRAGEIGDRQGVVALWNRQQPKATPGSQPIATVIADHPVIRLKCDLHGWMNGYVVVSDNPYHAVTGEDGRFEFKAPVGSLTIQAWHEFYGLKEQTVEVTQDTVSELTFSFDAMADNPIAKRTQSN